MWAQFGLLSLIWGSAFALIRLAVTTLPPVVVAWGRLTLAAAALGGAVAAAGLRLPRERSTWWRFAALGVVGNALPFFVISWGQTRIDSHVTGILLGFVPVGTHLLAHYLLPDERLTLRVGGGVLLGFSGVAVLLGADVADLLHGASGASVGKLAVLLGAVCYAFHAILTRRIPAMHPLVASTGVMICGSAALAPIALASLAQSDVRPSAASLGALVWLAVVGTGLATVVWFRLVASAGAGFATLTNYMTPLVAIACGALFWNEPIAPRAVLALVLVLGGIALSQSARRA